METNLKQISQKRLKDQEENITGGENSQTIKIDALETRINPFERRDSLQRTPPRIRTSSLPNMEVNKHCSEEFSETSSPNTTARDGPACNKRKKPTESPEKKNKDFEPEDPFARRDSVSRTPPLMRSNSLTGSLEPPVGTEQVTKRKKQHFPKENNGKNIKQGERLEKAIQKISKDLNTLDKIVSKQYNPKRELKETISRLLYQSEILQDNEIKNVLKRIQTYEEQCNQNPENQTQTSIANEIEIQELKRENLELRNRIANLERNQITKTGEAAQDALCADCEELKRKQTRRQLLKSAETFENYQRTTEEDWHTGVFQRIETRPGKIWEAPIEIDLILPCNIEFETDNRTVKRAIENYGGIEGLRKQNKDLGEVAMMIQTLGFPDKDENVINTSRNIYYPIITEKKQSEEAEDRDIFNSLKTLKTFMEKNGRRVAAVPEMGGIVGCVFIRMVEYLFDNTNIQVLQYNGVQDTDQYSKVLSKTKYENKTQKETNITTPNKKPTKPKGETVLVKMKDKETTYASLLKVVKNAVNPSDVGAQVKNIRKTKDGNILLTVQNGFEKAEALRKKIEEKVPEAMTSHVVDKKVIHIKNLDNISTVEDIREAITSAIGTGSNKFEVRALRPAYGQKQNVTIVMAKTDADKLINLRQIKIGWMNCKIVEREREVKCYRCWQYGHVKSNCNGPDREKLCVKCSQEGHKAAECKNNMFCVNCDQEGHQTGSTKCPVNKNRKRADISETK